MDDRHRPPGHPCRSVRGVGPSMAGISAWLVGFGRMAAGQLPAPQQMSNLAVGDCLVLYLMRLDLGWRSTSRLLTTRTYNCEPCRFASSGSLRRPSRRVCVINRTGPRKRSDGFGPIRWPSLNSVFGTFASCIMWSGTIPRWFC